MFRAQRRTRLSTKCLLIRDCTLGRYKVNPCYIAHVLTLRTDKLPVVDLTSADYGTAAQMRAGTNIHRNTTQVLSALTRNI